MTTNIKNGVSFDPSAIKKQVAFKVTTSLGKGLDRLALPETDLLVLTRFEHMPAGPALERIDALTGGAIEGALKASGFRGVAGEHVTIELEGLPTGKVLVVGLGTMDQFMRGALCGLFRLVLDQAVSAGARRLTMPIFPGRLSEISLKVSLAVLVCRVAERSAAHAGLGNLEEIEVLCAPQARRHVEEGLAYSAPVCPLCRDPRIGKD